MSLVELGARVVHHTQDPIELGVPAALLPRRRCVGCELAKDLQDFPVLAGGVLGRSSRCAACVEPRGPRLPRIYRTDNRNGHPFTESPSVMDEDL